MQLVAARHVFDGQPQRHTVAPGLTVAELLDVVLQWPAELPCVVTIDGHVIERHLWHRVRPKEGREMRVAVVLHGGNGRSPLKTILMVVAMIAIAVTAWYLGGLAAVAMKGAGYGLTAMTAAKIAVTVAVGAVGSIVMGAIGGSARPPAVPQSTAADTSSEASVYRLTAQRNEATPYGVIPRLFGQFRFGPRLASEPQIITSGRLQDFRALYSFGYGPLHIQDIRIGDSPVSMYRGAQYVSHPNHTASTPMSLLGGDWRGTPESVTLTTDWVTRTVAAANEVRVELTFPQGLGQLDRRGGVKPFGMGLDFAWMFEGESVWRPLTDLQHALSWDYGGSGALTASGVRLVAVCESEVKMAGGFGLGATTNLDLYLPQDAGPSVGDVAEIEGQRFTVTSIVGWQPNDTPPSGNTTWNASDYRPAWRVATSPSVPRELSGRLTRVLRIGSDGTPISVTAATRQPLIVVLRMWDLGDRRIVYRIRRTQIDAGDQSFLDIVGLTGTTAVRWVPVISPRTPQTTLELRLEATDQLNNSVDTVTALATSHAPVPNATPAFDMQPTRNPAALYLEVLTGAANPRPVSWDEIDQPAFVRWANWCDATSPQGDRNATCDLVIDTDATVAEVLQSIASVGRAQPLYRDGKHSILMDVDENRVPVQVFTSANAKDFSSSMAFVDVPHALRVRFTSEATWTREEILVYSDGYDASNATRFETLDLIGITRDTQAWRAGRILLADVRLRRERFEWSADIEHIVCQRGDLVLMQHDQLQAGGEPRRVASVDGDVLNLESPLTVLPSPAAATIRRKGGGGVVTLPVTAITEDSVTIPDHGAEPDDLIVIGEPDRHVLRLLVTAVRPGPDLTASIEAVQEAAEIEQAISGPIPNYVPPRFTPTGVASVTNLDVAVREVIRDRAPFYVLDVAWGTSGNAIPQTFMVERLNQQGDWDVLHQGSERSYALSVDRRTLAAEGETWRLRVRGVTRQGRAIAPAEHIVTLQRDKVAPPPVRFLSANVTGANTVLTWEHDSSVVDLAEFQVFFSPDLDATQGRMVRIGQAGPDDRMTSVTTRTGRYAIIVVDTSGNVSAPGYVGTIAEDLNDTRVSDTLGMFDVAGWTLDDGAEYLSTPVPRVRLKRDPDTGAYAQEGWFYSAPFALHTQPERTRFASQVDYAVESNAGNMDTWNPLSSVTRLSDVLDGVDYDVGVYMRTSSDGGVTYDSPFERVVQTDRDAGTVQFAVRMRSLREGISPSVTSSALTVATTRRVETQEDITIPAATTRYLFARAFGEGTTPVVAVTIQAAQNGDRAVVTAIDAEGFTLLVVNGSTSVSRVIDWSASGFGSREV